MPLHVHVDQPTSTLKEVLPWWPLSPLSLALSSILVLIPPPGDPAPGSTPRRRACSDMFANCALKSINSDIENLNLAIAPSCSGHTRESDNRAPFHRKVQFHLESILALITLGAIEYCRHGNIGKMRARINHAVTTAIDMSLHDLGRGNMDAGESQRRAWWMTVSVFVLGF